MKKQFLAWLGMSLLAGCYTQLQEVPVYYAEAPARPVVKEPPPPPPPPPVEKKVEPPPQPMPVAKAEPRPKPGSEGSWLPAPRVGTGHGPPGITMETVPAPAAKTDQPAEPEPPAKPAEPETREPAEKPVVQPEETEKSGFFGLFASSAPPATPVAEKKPAPPVEQVKPPPPPRPVVDPPAGRAVFFVRLANLAGSQEAERFAWRASHQWDLPVKEELVLLNGKKQFQVHAGPYPSRQKAEEVGRRLKEREKIDGEIFFVPMENLP